jgi:hypothetical protein
MLKTAVEILWRQRFRQQAAFFGEGVVHVSRTCHDPATPCHHAMPPTSSATPHKSFQFPKLQTWLVIRDTNWHYYF